MQVSPSMASVRNPTTLGAMNAPASSVSSSPAPPASATPVISAPSSSLSTSSFHTMTGNSNDVLSSSSPAVGGASNKANAFGGGVTSTPETVSSSKTPQPGWVGAAGVSNGQSQTSSITPITTTPLDFSKFQYGSNGVLSQTMFDYSQLPQQHIQQPGPGRNPWDSGVTSGLATSGHIHQADVVRAGAIGPAGYTGHPLIGFGTSDYFIPRATNSNSGVLGSVAGQPSGLPVAGQPMAGVTPASLLQPMQQHPHVSGALQMDQVDPYCYHPFPPHHPPSAPSTRISRKGKNPKKADGKQPTFLTRLYDLLDRPEYHHIIRWDEAGEMIIIERADELAEKILPHVYRQSRFASFSRQLNIYGWMRKVNLRHVDSGIQDQDASTWSHPFLRRNSTKEEILGFKRRVQPRLSQAQKNQQRSAQGSGSSDSDSFPGPAFGAPYTSGLLGGLDETRQVSRFIPPPSNPKLPKYMPPRPPLKTITRTNFGPEPTPPTQRPLPSLEQHQVPFTVERKDGSANRRRSMPTSLQRPAVDVSGRPVLNDLQEVTIAADNCFAPSSAPPTAATFSVQNNCYGGGPPSQTGSDASVGSALSVASSFTQNTRGMAELRLGGVWDDSAIEDEDLFHSNTMNVPRFRVDDPSTWARRGVGYLGQGMGYSPQVPVYGYVDPKMTTTTVQLQNLPNVAMPMQPTTMTPRNMNPSSDMMTGAMPMYGAIVAGGEVNTQPATPPSTVSPGVYQKGHGQPCQPWMSPSVKGSPALSTKQERRRSLTSPYSTGDSPRGHAGIVRGVGGNRKRDSLPNMPLTGVLIGQGVAGGDGSAEQANGRPGTGGRTTDDEGLPSASLDRPPLFSGQLEVDAGSSSKEMSASE